jgi:protein-disulfide isomerase
MNQPWEIVTAGAAVGAVVAVLAVFGFAGAGLFPFPSDRQMRSYLLSHPSLAIEMVQRAQAQEAAAEKERIRAAIEKVGLKTFFNPKIAYVTGPAHAKRSIVEFFDYNCPHCRNTFPAIRDYYRAHRNDTRFAFVEFPIFGKDSESAARTALAARLQPDKYIPFHFALMETEGAIGTTELIAAAENSGLDLNKLTEDVKNPELNKTLAAVHSLAERIGISGTPFFIVNGRPHEGEVTAEELERLAKG